MAQIPERLEKLVQQLKEGKSVNRQSARKILKWLA
jgi:hypothetical protein